MRQRVRGPLRSRSEMLRASSLRLPHAPRARPAIGEVGRNEMEAVVARGPMPGEIHDHRVLGTRGTIRRTTPAARQRVAIRLGTAEPRQRQQDVLPRRLIIEERDDTNPRRCRAPAAARELLRERVASGAAYVRLNSRLAYG